MGNGKKGKGAKYGGYRVRKLFPSHALKIHRGSNLHIKTTDRVKQDKADVPTQFSSICTN